MRKRPATRRAIPAWSTAAAAQPLPAADLERLVAMVERLEDVKDTATLMPLLGGAGGVTSEETRS
jgi:hypothetical protein